MPFTFKLSKRLARLKASFVTTGLHIGWMVSPLIFGQFLDHGHPRAVFLFIAACALVAVITVVLGMSGRRNLPQ